MAKDNLNKSQLTLKKRIFIFGCGIIFTIVLFELGIRLLGGVILFLQEYRNRVSIAQRGEYRILCLGESTTAKQYPPYLEEILNQQNIGIKFSVIDKGANPANTSFILNDLEHILDQYRPDMVIAMMGIDDKKIKDYKDIADANTVLSKKFKLYRLLKNIWMRTIKRPQEKATFEQGNNKEYSMLCTAIKQDPQDDMAYVNLGFFYFSNSTGELSEAEASFRKVLELNPKNEKAYVLLGVLCNYENRTPEAEVFFKKALELNPYNYRVYFRLGEIYIKQNMVTQAEDSFRRAMELNPRDDKIYFQIGRYYLEINKLADAQAMFKKSIALNLYNDKAYGGLAIVYEKMKQYNFAQKYYEKAEEIRLKRFSLISANNYRKLKKMLDKKKVKLVCVQYPMRNVLPLKKIIAEIETIIFVDNEKLFKKAIRSEGYNEYFLDNFGGDFGHCTMKGNRLLAGNIAKVILEECFSFRNKTY